MCRNDCGFSPPVMFRMNGIPTVINRKLCMQAKAGAESLPARGEGVGIQFLLN
jgi:hypothetical protein